MIKPLVDLMKESGIKPGQSIYFKKGHPSGLGAREIYFPLNPEKWIVRDGRIELQRKET